MPAPAVAPVAGRSGRWIGILVRAAALLVAARLVNYHVHPARSVGLVVAAVVLTAVSVISPKFTGALDRSAVAVGHAVGHVVTAAGIVLIEVGVDLPARLVNRLRGRDPLTGLTHGQRDQPQWRARANEVDHPRRAYGVDLPSTAPVDAGRPVSRAVRIIGWVAMVGVLNSAIGAVVRELRAGYGDHAPRTLQPAGPPPVLVQDPKPPDPRADTPAMRPYPFRRELFADQNRLAYYDSPYLTGHAANSSTRYFNFVNGVRRSWEPRAEPGQRLPVVWLLGGSTIWGEAQRDEHTIASELARIAARAGTPIRVVNLGVQGFVNFQDVLVFEQKLAELPSPDLALFYDGANDFANQISLPTSDPSHLPVAMGFPEDTGSVSPDSLYERWAETSVVTQIWRAIRGRSTAPPPIKAAVDDFISVWQRGIDLARLIAADHRVETRFYLQPAKWFDENDAFPIVRRRLPRGVVDLSDALDHPPSPVYVDAIHTNELGARLVAERMWSNIRGDVSQLGAG
jgi:hypothetical protein